jgi:DNA-binding transcriptional LysR family regulator
MPATALLAGKPVIDAHDLEGLDFVSFTPGTSFRYEVDQVFDRRGITRRMRVEATSQESVCNLVAAGAGVAVVSPFSAGVLHDGRLAIRPFTPALTVEIGLLAAEERLSIAARCFQDFVIEHFRLAAAEPLRVA